MNVHQCHRRSSLLSNSSNNDGSSNNSNSNDNIGISISSGSIIMIDRIDSMKRDAMWKINYELDKIFRLMVKCLETGVNPF